MDVFGDLYIRSMIQKNIMETSMICNLQAHCKNYVFRRNFEIIPTSCELQIFLQTVYDKFKYIALNNAIISYFDIIGLLRIVVIDEITKFEI